MENLQSINFPKNEYIEIVELERCNLNISQMQ